MPRGWAPSPQRRLECTTAESDQPTLPADPSHGACADSPPRCAGAGDHQASGIKMVYRAAERLRAQREGAAQRAGNHCRRGRPRLGLGGRDNAAPPAGCARAAGPGPQWGCGRSWGLDASTAHGSAHAAAQAENSRPASLNKQFFAYYLPRAQAAPLYRGAASAGDKRMPPGGRHATRKCAARQGAGLHRAEPVAPRGPPQSRGPRGSTRGAPGAPK